MLHSNTEEKDGKMLVGAESANVEVGVETHPSSCLVFPPVPTLLQGQPVQPLAEPLYREGTEGISRKSLEAELDHLLSRRDSYSQSDSYLYKAAGLAALCGRLDDAQELAKKATESNAEDSELKYRLGEICFRLNELDAAERIWLELANNRHLLSCLRMAELFICKSEYGDAKFWIDKAMDVDEFDWRVQMFAGTLSLILGEFEQSIRCFRVALDSRPRSVRLHYNIALAHIVTGQIKNAFRSLRVAIGLNPFHKKAIVALADLGIHERRGFLDISRLLSRYVGVYPDDKSVIVRLGKVLAEQGDDGRARRLLSDAMHRLQDPAIANNLGVLFARGNDLGGAIKEFGLAARGANDFPISQEVVETATANLVSTLLRARLFDQAKALARAYLEANRESEILNGDPSYRIADGLIRAHLGLHELNDAVSLAKQWIKEEIHYDFRIRLSETLACYFSLHEGRMERAYPFAIEAYNMQAASLIGDKSNLSIATNNLVFVMIEVGKMEEARRLAMQLKVDIPEHMAYSYATRGLLAIRVGDVEKGEGLYRRAISLANNQDSKALIRKKLNWELGRYWASKGSRAKARRFLEKVLKVKIRGVWKMPYLEADVADLLKSL